VSEQYNYTRPTFHDNETIIKEGRHPVIERVMDEGMFVPNDVHLHDDRTILLITGPNMSGKSTYMRQLALINIMAQIGCFVPATEAQLTIFDRIFTRIGAADDLVRGQSTFMVEMLEANYALANATKQSLILLDEIGRGTSTYDGMALAQAIIEYIHEHIQAKTIFSTHYHELTALEDQLPNVKNIYVRAEEFDNEIVFLHKIEEGRANESYGIHVAKLAQLPDELIERATVILAQLEKNSAMTNNTLMHNTQLAFIIADDHDSVKGHSKKTEEVEEVLEKIKTMKINNMTPIDALNQLVTLQQRLLDEN